MFAFLNFVLWHRPRSYLLRGFFSRYCNLLVALGRSCGDPVVNFTFKPTIGIGAKLESARKSTLALHTPNIHGAIADPIGDFFFPENSHLLHLTNSAEARRYGVQHNRWGRGRNTESGGVNHSLIKFFTKHESGAAERHHVGAAKPLDMLRPGIERMALLFGEFVKVVSLPQAAPD